MPGAVDNAKPVSITVKGKPDIGLPRCYPGDQRLHVFRLTGIGMMVGKCPIDVAIHFLDLVAQGAKQLRGDITRHTVAAINDDLQARAVRHRRNVAGNSRHIIGADICRRQPAMAAGKLTPQQCAGKSPVTRPRTGSARQ